jgi:hypothetical protein
METINNPKLTERLKKRYSANFNLRIEFGNVYIDDIFAGKTNLKNVKKWKIKKDKILLFGQKNNS